MEKFSDEVNTHAYICMIIALVCLWGAYTYFSYKISRNKTQRKNICDTPYIQMVRKLSKYIFFMTSPFAGIYRIALASYVSAYGYENYYTDYSLGLSENTVLYLISKIEIIMPVTFCIFIATLPNKKEFKVPAVFYLAYLVLSLGSGQRSTFMLGLLLLFIFLVYMQGLYPEEIWFKRNYIIYGVAMVPILAVMGTVYNIVRFGGEVQGINLFESFCDFFYDQGVSSNIIKRAFMYAEDIPGDSVYFFEFLHSGIIARLLNITVYNGNTIEHALYGNSFTHALGYTILGNGYLMGRGTGTSYLAELYYDFGYIGIAVGTVVYGWLFTIINKIKSNNLFSRALIFTVITQLLWAPRGSYTGFISFLGAPSTIITFLLVFGGAKLLFRKYTSTYHSTVKVSK